MSEKSFSEYVEQLEASLSPDERAILDTFRDHYARAVEQEQLYLAFLAGFAITREGWNAEHPYDQRDDDLSRIADDADLREAFRAWYESSMLA